MISDVLFEACEAIQRYLTDPVFASCYAEMQEEILQVYAAMDALRQKLDTPPTPEGIRLEWTPQDGAVPMGPEEEPEP